MSVPRIPQSIVLRMTRFSSFDQVVMTSHLPIAFNTGSAERPSQRPLLFLIIKLAALVTGVESSVLRSV